MLYVSDNDDGTNVWDAQKINRGQQIYLWRYFSTGRTLHYRREWLNDLFTIKNHKI